MFGTIFILFKKRAVFEVRNTDNTVLKIKFDSKQNVEKYDIIRNEVSINININKDSSENSSFKRGLASELLNSFIRRIEELLINETRTLITIVQQY